MSRPVLAHLATRAGDPNFVYRTEVPRFSFEPQKHLLLKTKSINFDRDLSVGAPARQRMSRFQEAPAVAGFSSCLRHSVIAFADCQVQARGRADSGEEPAGVAGLASAKWRKVAESEASCQE